MSDDRFEEHRTENVRRTPRSPTGEAEVERSRFSPYPLAGDEPLRDHEIDPDEVEEMLDDALIAAEEDEQSDGEAEAEPPALVSATLGDRRGLGVMRLVWDSEGDVVDTMGSWRQLEESPDGMDVISGERSRFVGALHLAEGNSVPIDTEVIITGRGEYTDVHGERVRLVRFEAPSLVGEERFAHRDPLP